MPLLNLKTKKNMKKSFLSISKKSSLLATIAFYLLGLLISNQLQAQISGTKTVCTSGCDYSTIADAVTALNTSGVGSGGVTIEVSSGHTETLSAAINLTATGTASNPIKIYTPAGGGANAKITAYSGAGTMDGIFVLSGSDYVTIDGIDLAENSSNTTNTTRMEWGYALLKKNASTTPDGCNYNTIVNCTITLNKANTGTAGLIAGCTGIYMANHVINSTTGYTYSDTTSNSSNYNQILSNTITNVYKGIVLYGRSSSNATYDVGNVVGKVGAGNTISNFGGSSTAVYGMYIYAQNRVFIDGNTLDGGDQSTSTMYGIYTTTGTNATIRIRSNTISLKPVQATSTTAYTGTVYGIYSSLGSSGTNNIVEILDNELKDWDFSNSTSSTVYGIYNLASGYNVRMDGNSFNNNVFGSTVLNCTGTHYNLAYSATNANAGSVSSFSNNTVSNYSRINTSTGAGGSTYSMYILGGGLTFNITENKVQSNTYRASTGTIAHMYISPSGSGTYYASKNVLTGNTRQGPSTVTGTSYLFYWGGSTTATNWCFNNTVGSLTLPSTGHTGTVYGIYFNGSTNQNYIYGNKVSDINAGGGTIYGIANTYGTTQIYNNIVGNLTATYSNLAQAIRGIDVAAGTAANVYYNTVYIPATSSSGASFGSTAFNTSISIQTRFNNNIFINLATPGSSGRTVAHWRNGISPDKIDVNSQSNILYAGSPSATRLIYWDGVLGCQTILAYQKRLKIAEMGSATENVSFISTTGTSADFLHVNTSTGTRVESNGNNIIGITNDFDNITRQGNTGYSGSGSMPDIGADEGNFTPTTSDAFPPALYNVNSPVSCSSTSRIVKVSIVDAGGVPVSGGTVPRLYYKKGKQGTFQSTAGSLAAGTRFNGIWNFTVNFSSISLNSGDTAYVYCIVQDSASTPNISSFPAGATASSVNSVSAAPRDTVYFINSGAAMGGTYTVGGSGADYSTISAAVSDLAAKGLCGPATISINPGVYREKVSVPNLVGSSMENYVIFESSTGNADDVVIIDSSLTSTDAYVWRFNTSKYMTLRKVTLLSKGPSFGWGLNIMGANTHNIKIKNCNIMVNDSASSSSNRIAVVINGSSSSYSTGAKVDTLEIDSNNIKYGYFGIVCYGASTTSRIDNIFIRNNNIYGAYAYGSYNVSVSGLKFSNNIIAPKQYSTTMSYGLYASSVGQYLTSAPTDITNNKITAMTYGIYLTSCSNTSSSGLIANNIIQVTNNYGMYLPTCNLWNIYHNTINLTTSPTYGIYNTTNTCEIKNNLIAITSTSSTTAYCIYNSVANIAGNIDNNVYWNPIGTNIMYNGAAYSSANFNTVNAGGAGSKIIKPIFNGFDDLRISFSCDLRFPFLSTVPQDIFKTTRSTSMPIAGAHEAKALTHDVSIVSILSPNFPITAGSQNVRVRILNNGETALDTVTVGYSVNGGTPVSQTFVLSPPLAQCDTLSVVLTSGYNHTAGCISLRAWTANPNNQTDLNQANDTSGYLNFGIPLNGTYTIGGSTPDFTTLNEAVNTMKCGGITGAVTFNIRPGEYRERVSVPNILGASNTNWITFQSSTNNADDVIVIDSTMSTSFVGNHYAWRFDNAKYMTLRNVSTHIKGVYGWGIHVFGANSKKINIKGCKSSILGDSVSTSTFNIPLVVNGSITSYSTGAKIDSLQVDSNYFKYGWAGISFYGASSTSRGDDNFIRNNNFYGSRSYGAYFISQSGLRFQNNFMNAKYCASYGVYMSTGGQYLTSAATEISGNKIINAVGSYAVYLASVTNSSSARGLFANNMISFETTSGGAYFTSSDQWDIFHNSINQYAGAATYGMYSSVTGNIFKNNIFAMNSPTASTTGYALYSSGNVGSGNIDNNIYWNPRGTNTMYHAGAYTSSTYKTAAAGGLNSNYAKPTFYSNLDLRITNGCLATGTPISLVPKDYFGTNRSATEPVIGAHEVQPPSYSASAARVITPASSSISLGTYDIEIEVRNTGTTTISSLDLTYTLNGTPVSDNFSGLSIAPCGLDTLKFTSTKAATFGAGYNEVRAYTGLINGTSADNLNLDDTSATYGFCAQLSGNYTINASGSGSSNFKSFTKAVTALYNCGIVGPVTFTVSAGTYVEQGSFPGLIPGASKTNTVTFDGVNATQCKISWNTTSSDPRHVVQFVGVKHLRFLNIGIENTGATYGWGISMKVNGSQGCDSMLIKGCIIDVNQNSTSSNFAGIVISNSNTSVSATGHNANFSILDSNTINGGYYGISWYGAGTSTSKSKSNILTRNTFNNQYYYGMNLYYHDSMEIASNRINNLGRATNTFCYGMYLNYLDAVRVVKNRICGQSGGYGIIQYYNNGTPSRRCQISNNMINVGTAGTSNTAYGIYSNYPKYNDLVYNSVVVDGTSTGNTPYYGYYYYGTVPNIYNNNRIYNNNFINNGLGYAMYVYGLDYIDIQGAVSGMDNNNYKTNGSNIFYFNGASFSSFSTWSSASYMGSTMDTNSISLDPEFFSNCDMHTLSLDLDSTGIALTDYTEDIDGETRSTTKTDIGADEYTPPANNLGPQAILKPQAPAAAGMTDVWVTIKNFGKNTVDSSIVNYKIGKNGTVKSIKWKVSLSSLQSDTAKFTGSNQYLLTIAAKDTLYVFTSEPNGVTDGYTLNDTIMKTTCGALSGNFTIGGTSSSTNYATWQEATTTLASCGVSAPVVFDVAAGTYTEQVLLNTVPGATGNNTVTFQSADRNPSSVTLQYASPLVSANNYTFKLKGAKRIILRDLTLATSSTNSLTNYGNVITFDVNGAVTSDSNVLYNNIINGMNTNQTSSFWCPIISTNAMNNDNRVVKNTINNGSYSMYWNGPTPTTPNLVMPRGLVIDSNVLNNFYYIGVVAQYQENVTITNNTITSNSPYGSKRGISFIYGAKGGNISNNTIKLSEDVAYGLLVQYPAYYYTNWPSYSADSGTKKFWVLNNSISCLGTTSSSKYGIYLLYPTNTMFYHNTSSIRGAGIAFYCTTTSDTAFKLMNNNFATESGAPASFNGVIGVYKSVDYNNYYNATVGGQIASLFGSGRGTLTSMQGAFYSTPAKSDQNSKNVNPSFVSTTDLHLRNPLLASGINVGVSNDIEGKSRVTSSPSIGAYEFAADLKVTEVMEPLTICKTATPTIIKLKIKNVGYTQAINYTLNYKLNNGPVQSHLVTASLDAGDSIIVSHSVPTVFNLEGMNNLKAFTSYPFDISTNDTFNGTIDVKYLPRPSYKVKDTCAGANVQFTSNSTVTGSTITNTIWSFGDGSSASGNTASHTFATSGISYNVKIISTSSFGCIDSSVRAVLILTPLGSGTIGKNQSICYNTVPSLLTSTSSASGSQGPYTYQWQSSSDNVNFNNITGATGLDYQPGTLTSTVYYRRVTRTVGGCGPNNSNTVTITTNPLLTAGTIGSSQTICYNGTGLPIKFATKPTGAFGVYTYQWQQSPDSATWSNISGKTDTSFTPTNVIKVTFYRVLVFSGSCPSVGSNGVKVKLYSPITGGTIASGQTICAGYTPAGLTQVTAPSGGPGTYTFQWQSSTDSINWNNISGANSATYSSPALSGLTYFQRLAQSTGCPSGTSNALKIRTLPKPNIVFSASNHCYNDPMPLSNTSTISSGTLTYLWRFGDGGTSTSSVPNKVYSSSGTYNVTLVGTSNLGCKDSLTKSVVVATTPTASFTFALKCQGDSVIFTDNTLYACYVAGMKFDWTFGDGKTSNVQHARHHYTSPGTYNVKFRISLPGGFKDSITKVVVFNIKATPSFTATNECYPSATSFTNNSTNYASLAWTYGDGSTSSTTSSSFTKTYAIAGVYSAKLVATSSFGCRDSIIKTVNVFSKPKAVFSAANNCLGITTSFNNASSGANNYSWDFGDGKSSSSTNPTNSYATSGTYTVKLKVSTNNGCVDSTSTNVTIYANPVANFITANVCDGFLTTYSNTSTGASSYKWDFGNGNTSTSTNPTYTYPTAGNYTVTLIATTSNGCSNTISKSYTVYSSPTANFSGSNVCLGNSITFNNSSSGATSQVWDFGDATASTATNPSKTYGAAGNFNVKLVITNVNGCKDSITKSITIYAKPTPAFSASNQCLGTAVSFVNQSTSASSNVWSFGDGKSSAATSPNYTYSAAGTYTAKLVVTSINGCKDSISKAISVYQKPVVSFTANPNPICRGGLMTFANTTTNGASYIWTFGNGATSTSSNPSTNYNTHGNYNVKLVAISSNGCKDSLTKGVTVWPRPVASFKVNDGCTGDNLAFGTNSVGAVSHEWTFGDATTSTTANPSKAYSAPGSYNVKLIVTSVNGCKDTSTSSVTVNPRANVSFTNSSNFCLGLSAAFTNTSTLSSGSMTHQWSFGDGNTSSNSNSTNTYTSAGNYTVKLTTTTDKGCSNSATSSVIVFAKPTANYNANSACAGGSVTFTNTSVGGTTNAWDFGDAGTSSLASPTHTYSTAGTYNVKLTVTNSNNCTDVITKQIVIHTNPSANFTFTDRCIGQNIQFTNSSTGANDVYWQFGDGNSSNSFNPSNGYKVPGNYNVTLTVESLNGCLNSVTKSVNIFAGPQANFITNNQGQCITGNNFVYTDNSSISSGTFTRAWAFGDGGTSTNANPTKSYATSGTYTVKLILTSNNGCKDSVSNNVMVYPKPVANYTINNPSQCYNGHLFSFSDASTLSQGSLDILWKFGDGSTSGGTNAVKKYLSSGTYAVSLKVVSDFGCSDSITKNVTVNPSPLASFTFNDEIQCLNGNSFMFTNTTTGASLFNSAWKLGDGSSISTTNASRSYSNAGNYTVRLNVSTPFGCKDSAYYTMRVLANPSAITISGPNTATNGSVQVYSITATPGSTYNWVASNGTVLSNGADRIQIRWNTSGSTGTISVIETGENGCQGNPANYNVTLSPTNSAYTIARNAFAANLYPNPSTSNFTIEVGTGDMVNMSVYDQLGREVMNGKRFSTSITVTDHNLASGIYTVKLVTDKGRTTILRFEVKN
jgi:PKD repeat protein